MNLVHLAAILVSSGGRTVALRDGVMTALIALPPCTAIDFNDELEMAKQAEAAWPCAKITRIRQGIEAERHQASAST